MFVTANRKLMAGLAACFIFLPLVIAKFAAAQDPQLSPTPAVQPSVESSASPSPTPTPPRVPTPTPFPGAQNAHQWGSISVFNGLPSDGVRAIAQTNDGVMWFGTDSGLARFDGRRIQKVPLREGAADSVSVLRTSKTGELWIGTADGAVVYSAGRFEDIEHTQGVSITDILLSGEEQFLGTAGGQVMRVRRGAEGRPAADAILPEPVLDARGSPLAISSMAEVGGSIVAGTAGKGVYVVSGARLIEFPTSPRPIFVNSLEMSTDGKVFLGTDAGRGGSGVYLAAQGSRAERLSAPTSDVLSIEMNEGGLWAGTERNGLFHFSEGKLKKSYTFANTSGGLRSDTIYTLFTDREGVLWIGTNRGVSRFDQMGPFQETISEIANSNFIRTLYCENPQDSESDQPAVLAGSNRGLFERNGTSWNEIAAFRGRPIYAIHSQQGAAGTILIGTQDGVFDRGGRPIVRGEARSIAALKGRTYAAVYGRGVVDVSGSSPRVVLANERVTSLAASAGSLWIGTEDGDLFRFDGKNAKIEIGRESLKSGTVWSIREGGQGTGLWIGGQHGVFFIRDGVPELVAAAEDVRDVWAGADGSVWAATTTKGVIHARRDDRFGWLASTIGFEQGLPSEKAFAIVPVNDKLLFATNRGVVTYNPGTLPPKLIPVRLLSQRVHDLAEAASQIALEYPQNSLLIEVAGQSSRTFPEEFQYAFVLTNSKGQMVDSRLSNDPQYSPQDLPSGEYTIESIAFDRDLNASEPLVIRFSVATAPFPWTATALGVLLAISLFGLVLALIEHRRIKQRTRELTAARFDLANEAERERRRIARDLHDQTLADLRNLMINSDKLAGTGSFRSEIESVSTEIRRICEDLSPSVLENVGLVAALEFLLSKTVENGSFSADDAAEDLLDFPINVQLQIYRIAQEVLTNISRHSNAGAVEVGVKIPDHGRFLLSIRDNGMIFQPSSTNGSGRGVANIRSRANLIGAKVNWKPDKRGWNVFTLSLDQAPKIQPVT